MTPEPHMNVEEKQPIGQGEPPVEPPSATPSAPPAKAIETRREGPPPAIPAETPPPGGITAGIQRMAPGWRWTLGLGLAFLSGLAALAALYGVFPAVNTVGLIVTLIVAFVMALAAGFTLSSWRAALALVIAAAAGGLAGSWLVVLIYPDTSVEGLKGMSAVLILFAWFAVFSMAPLIVILLIGISAGRWRGLDLRRPRAPSVG